MSAIRICSLCIRDESLGMRIACYLRLANLQVRRTAFLIMLLHENRVMKLTMMASAPITSSRADIMMVS
jgi:hypothetical protein